VRLVLVPAVLEAATVAAESSDNPVAVERAFDALPSEDGFANCCVDVSCPVVAGVPDIREEILDFHRWIDLFLSFTATDEMNLTYGHSTGKQFGNLFSIIFAVAA